MDATAQSEGQRLIELLTEQRALYKRLEDLSARQRNLISGDRPELLLNILRDRQVLVSALARINEQLSPFRRDWEAISARLPAQERTTASELLEEINGVLQAILKTDQEDGALLAARKQATARALGDVSGGRVANAAYARQARFSADGAADVTG